MDRQELYNSFLEKFPLESLNDMTLDMYTNLDKQDSFCYWLESITSELGSIWGGSSYKFRIFRYANRPNKNNDKYTFDKKYAWFSSYKTEYGLLTAEDVFERVKIEIIFIAKNAKAGNFEEINKNNFFGETVKWKIAFLYSNLSLIPIYKKEMLISCVQKFGLKADKKTPFSTIQKFLLSKKGNKNLFAFYDELLSIINNNTNYWIYSPDTDKVQWEVCQKNKYINLAWKELGDFSLFESEEDIKSALQDIPAYSTNIPNIARIIWDFTNVIKPGDIIFVRGSQNTILGYGKVTNNYCYDESLENFANYIPVEWIYCQCRAFTFYKQYGILNNISNDLEMIDKLQTLVNSSNEMKKPNNYSIKKFWWLNANPKYWSFSKLKNGETIDYKLYNDNGNKRRIFQNFLDARKGDKVIGYEATPTKAILALAEVESENNGETVTFKKTESLTNPIPFSDFKNLPELQKMEFLKNINGSFFKLTEEEYNFILDLIREENPLNNTETFPSYTKNDFLNEVYIQEYEYEELKSLLLYKKNLILQGAPGVGKTFSAKRLAYSILGQKDDSKIEFVQFHQSYSYEDFVMGYKPLEDGGFRLERGIFYKFCQKAISDPDNKYFFIVDEINRGNLSKIFGELFMLIENSHRDEDIKLAYIDEDFRIPSNLYIIGMMNTADRSLAMIDYALRRRFSFYEMKPAYQTTSFKNYISSKNNDKLLKIIDAIKSLNNEIAKDDSLGSGFLIGHSYFCNNEVAQNLDNIIKFEIIPMLREYWFDNNDKFNIESKKLIDCLK